MVDAPGNDIRFKKGRFVTFAQQPGGPPAAPYQWPQDVLKVPNGFGGVPLINDLNANLGEREPFFMEAAFGDDFNTHILPGEDLLITLQVPADGDFWVDNIACMFPVEANLLASITPLSSCLLQITDVGTGYKFFPSGNGWDGVGINLFNCFQLNTFTAPLGQPYGAGQRTSMIQPYCFLRGSSIEVRLTNPIQGFPSPASDLPLKHYVNLAGWKEYKYAAS